MDQNLTVDEIRSNNISLEQIFQGRSQGITGGGFTSTLFNPGPFQTSYQYTAIKTSFPFSNDTLSTHGPFLSSLNGIEAGSSSSSTHGYRSGGRYFSSQPFPAPGPDFLALGHIDKFPFSNLSAGFSDIGDLITGQESPVARGTEEMVGNSSSTHGYASGGSAKNPPFLPPFSADHLTDISKFSFATDGNATDVGDTTASKELAAGQNSTVSGYMSGGHTTPFSVINVIEKFPFASDGNSSDIGDLTVSRQSVSGMSSITHGYSAGGDIPPSSFPVQYNTIDKFPFSSDTNATDVGNLSVVKDGGAGISGYDNGYMFGGSGPTGADILEKFSFSSDGNASNVGNSGTPIVGGTGHQD